MEWGGDSHVGRYNDGPHLLHELRQESDHAEQDGLAYSDEGFARASCDSDWSESYMLDLMAWHLRVQQAQPRLAGTAQWAFKDFGTPLRPENPIPYVNQKGLVDRANRPKSLYHLFQAAQTATPVCRLEAHDWPLRAGEPTAKQRVRVITNCATVELFVNGRSQGVVTEGWLRSWHVTLRAGVNELHAMGRSAEGRLVEDHATQTLVQPGDGTPARWLLTTEPTTWRGQPVRRLMVQLAAADGTPLVGPEQRVTFRVTGGAGRFLCDLGTIDGSATIETANGRAAILLAAPDEADVVVSVDCAALEPTEWIINQVEESA